MLAPAVVRYSTYDDASSEVAVALVLLGQGKRRAALARLQRAITKV